MMSEEDASKAIPPCEKKTSTLEELLDKCHFVGVASLMEKDTEDSNGGIVSFSINQVSGLNFCVWREVSEGLECVVRVRTEDKLLAQLCGGTILKFLIYGSGLAKRNNAR